jgi:hypothetical protein
MTCLPLASVSASSFEACLFNIDIIGQEENTQGSGTGLSLLTSFKPLKYLNKDKSQACTNMIGKKITKPLVFKSKQHIPFIKKGNTVVVDFSHFIIDKNDPSLNLEVWKVVNVKTKRADHD